LFISLGNQWVVNNSWKQMMRAPFSMAIWVNLTAFSIFRSFSSQQDIWIPANFINVSYLFGKKKIL
jgi:hypothetical protein